MEEFPSFDNNKKTTFPLRSHYLSKEAFPEMLMRILNKQVHLKNHLLNIYQAPGLFKDQWNEKARLEQQ